MNKTTIAWSEVTWNPVVGCTRVSEGCRHCYAERMAARLANNPRQHTYTGIAEFRNGEPRWTGRVKLVPEKLSEPLRWRTPRMVFVNSMSDLFHEKLGDDEIAAVFGVMAAAPQHTFQILTKRPGRAAAWFEAMSRADRRGHPAWTVAREAEDWLRIFHGLRLPEHVFRDDPEWPLPNVWLGTSTEDQKTADERIPHLLRCPAAVRFVSAEPLLGPIDLMSICNTESMAEGQDFLNSLSGFAWTCTGPDYVDTCGIEASLDWVIIGGESGPGARPCNIEWIRALVAQCKEAAVAVFVKQLGTVPVGVQDYSCDPWTGTHRPRAEKQRRDMCLWPAGTRFGNPTRQTDLNGRIAYLNHSKGGDPAEWPEDLRVREMPVHE